jgi:hypothetical protein
MFTPGSVLATTKQNALFTGSPRAVKTQIQIQNCSDGTYRIFKEGGTIRAFLGIQSTTEYFQAAYFYGSNLVSFNYLTILPA